MDPRFMEKAIESAREGILCEHGGPFGAVITRGNECISIGHNTVLKDQDPTCHAEMNAIRSACQALNTHILDDCVLYTTAEPCPMCLAAIYWARIPKVYVGVRCQCAAHYGFDDSFFYDELKLEPEKRQVSFTYGVLEEACEAVFATWKERSGELY